MSARRGSFLVSGEAESIRGLERGESSRQGVSEAPGPPSWALHVQIKKHSSCLWQGPSLEVSQAPELHLGEPCSVSRGGPGWGALGSTKASLGFGGGSSLLPAGGVLVSSLGPRLWAPLTGGRRCTARQQSAHPAHWLLQRRAAPAPQGNPALRGSCCGQWTRSRQAGTRCQQHKGACRSLGREGVITTSSWNLPPLPPLWSLETRAGDPGVALIYYADRPQLARAWDLGGAAVAPGDDPRAGLVGRESRLHRRLGGGSGTGFGLAGRSAQRDRVAYTARVHLGKESEVGSE